MKRLSLVALTVFLTAFAAGCDDESPTSPSDTSPRFASQLAPGNEVPPVTNADASGSGSVAVSFNVTRDGSGNITAATADFQVSLSGFPNGTTLTGAHIHPGPAGVNGGIVVNLGLAAGEFVLGNGAVQFSKNGINVPADVAQNITNNPSQFYFNVHTTLTPSGAVRGQLSRTQ
jgi:hypothetical protein